MSTKGSSRLIGFLMVISFILSACAAPTAAPTAPPPPTAAPTQSPPTAAPTQQPPTAAPTQPAPTAVPTQPAPAPTATSAAAGPTKLRTAFVMTEGLENDWDLMFYQSFQRVQAKTPHGLQIDDIAYTTGGYGADLVRVMREYAATGKYDIIYTDGGYVEQMDALKTDFPNVMFVQAGYPIGKTGGNVFFVLKYINEATYLMGYLAGKLTKTNIVGAVAPFPYEDVSSDLNGFFDGARAANPNVKIRVSFTQSWYDPPKSLEAANAQIAAGVDQMFMRAEGWEACEQKKIVCYGTYVDNTKSAPNTNLANAFGYWDPEINWTIDQWWSHAAAGGPYNAPTDPAWFGMVKGGSALSPLNPKVSVPQDVLDALKKVQQDILDGKTVVAPNTQPPESDK